MLRREEARKRFAALAEKAKALRDVAKTEPQRELASKLLIATRLGIGGRREEAERAIDDAQKRYSSEARR